MAKNNQKRPGRPKSESKLEFQIFTRLDAATNAALEAAAVKLERPPAWIVRKAVEEWLQRNK